MNRTLFQWGVVASPLIVGLLIELQRQATERQIDGWSFLAVGTGLLGSLVMTVFNTTRANTEDEKQIVGSGR